MRIVSTINKTILRTIEMKNIFYHTIWFIGLHLVFGWSLKPFPIIGYGLCMLMMYWIENYVSSNQPPIYLKMVNVIVRHGGNQDIPEFKDGKSMRVMMNINSSILCLKEYLAARIKNVKPEHIKLKTAVFGRDLDDKATLEQAWKWQNNRNLSKDINVIENLPLFIVIPGY